MQLSRALAALERRLPLLARRLKRAMVERAVPLNRAIGLRVDAIADDSSHVSLRLPQRRRNLNLAGTVHGGVLTALAETVHGVAVLWQLSPATHAMVTRELRMQFLAPARGELRVDFGLPPQVLQRIEADLAECGRCDVGLESEVKDGSGLTVARLSASYVIRIRAGGRARRGSAP